MKLFKNLLYKFIFTIKKTYPLSIFDKLFTRIKFKLTAKKMFNEIKAYKKDRFIYVYDFKVSGLSIGEFFVNMMLIKLISYYYKNIQVIFIIDEYPKNFDKILKKNKKKRINQILDLAKYILDKNVKINFMKWSIFRKKIKKKFLFRKIDIINRKPIYRYAAATIYLLYKKKFFNKFILSKKINKLIYKRITKNNYVTFGVRYNYANDTERNYKDHELILCCEWLIKKFPKKKIVVLCEKSNLTKLKKILELYIKKNKIIFSKDRNDHIIYDLEVILNSQFFFSYKSSGITAIAEFTNVRYLSVESSFWYNTFLHKGYLPNDHYHSLIKKFPWQDTATQIHAYEIKKKSFLFRSKETFKLVKI